MWEFWVDRGGTFTDIIAKTPEKKLVGAKVLSENPELYSDAPMYGIQKILSKHGLSITEARIKAIKMGTTVTTNALLQRTGLPTALVVTKGFRDIFEIGDQSRSDLFSLKIVKEKPLYHVVVEVEERIAADGKVVTPLNESMLSEELQSILDQGIYSCAIVCLHGYRYPHHEQRIAEVARALGFKEVVCSYMSSPMRRLIPRGNTTVLDAYLNPVIKKYWQLFQQQWGESEAFPILFMQSNGGLCSGNQLTGKNSLLSGPAGGVIGAVKSLVKLNIDKIVAFDMGGTSTDVCHYAGIIERAMELQFGQLNLQTPTIAIHTVAAGGGSLVKFHQDRYQVGPESSGAHPGPACYGQGGPATVTDCNLILGRLVPAAFPKIFGPDGDRGLDIPAARAALESWQRKIKDDRSLEGVAEAFLNLAIFNMANAIRKITTEKGVDLVDYTLCSLGSASGQVVCRISDELGIKKIIIHPMAGLLSAFGIGNADKILAFSESINRPLRDIQDNELHSLVEKLKEKYCQLYKLDQHSAWSIKCYLKSSDSQAKIPIELDQIESMKMAFEKQFQMMFGFIPERNSIQLDLMELEYRENNATMDYECQELEAIATFPKTQKIFCRGQYLLANIKQRNEIGSQRISGPLIILDQTGTNIVDPGWTAHSDAAGNLILSKNCDEKIWSTDRDDREKVDSYKIELFGRLFQQISERMGVVLQRTSRSVNIRERLDFSCAIFDQRGNLVANAPHIPVHLGSMSSSVKSLLEKKKYDMTPGDSFIHNDPYSGGTHLPDLTVITPVFYKNRDRPLFFIASRGHHADIGGISPGSMPAFSKSIDEEGIMFGHDLIVRQGEFRQAFLEKKLRRATYPARQPETNLADIKAQLAANQKGIQDLFMSCDRYGLEQVLKYMQGIQDNAAKAILSCYDSIRIGKSKIIADNGIRICCSVNKNPKTRKLVFDFTGSSWQQQNNFNAPYAVVKAAILYCIRCLLAENIPLNDGLLNNIDIIIPPNSCLAPQYPAAVVAGNVELSQLVVDAILEATQQLANSQGTMNNLTFGNKYFQYYETICGGMGAGAGFSGTSTIQSHMTNSRLTDPEVIESQFPIRVETFKIRRGSGGKGAYAGGDGAIRVLRFLTPMQVSMIGNRRTSRPQGIGGGGPAKPGENILMTEPKGKKMLLSCFLENVNTNDMLVIKTPGGGAYGKE